MVRELLFPLEQLPQQPGLLGDDDDWRGVTNSNARRKVQNRVNQRAYRKRRHLEAVLRTSSSSRSQSQDQQHREDARDEMSNSTSEARLVPHVFPETGLWTWYGRDDNCPQLDRQILSLVTTICKYGPLDQQKLVSEFQRWVERCHRLGSPRADHLLVLIKFNVLRAIVTNGISLGYTAGEGVYNDDNLSPFTNLSNESWQVQSVPVTLHPTVLQRQIPHHPWIDILPSPVMRDNLLLAGDNYDVMDLCADLVGFFSADKGRMGLIVWGEPWDVAGWEVTESFLKHWGWTVRGCEQLLRATNYWRERRAERPLRF